MHWQWKGYNCSENEYILQMKMYWKCRWTENVRSQNESKYINDDTTFYEHKIIAAGSCSVALLQHSAFKFPARL